VKTAPQERSYEELASLARSVVMIVVHDATGEPVGSGSGIAVHPDGYILTNCHVIRRGCVFTVRIENDDAIYQTKEIIKYHTEHDLALIRIHCEMPPLPVYDGRRNLRRGERVFAIGSPLGLFNSVSDGIISGFRDIDGQEMIQFTAPTSHGSSGGALLNFCGELIGICTGGIDEGQNINLAVNYQDIRDFAGNFLI
jgi:S1-C subfamily serine protease